MNSLRWPSPAATTTSTTALVVTTTAVATATLVIFARAALWPRRSKVIAGPLSSRATAHASGRDELDGLVYQPDQFPGARDVKTPYGHIRVYEFGPEDGEKVLLVHGISTSCVTLGPLAHAHVKRGCRVMLFDLFGRGFTDGVGDLPHDDRLYTTQILLVLASSHLPWTGDNAFRLVGYSMGGGVAVSFATAYPNLVSSLVLLAPTGLIRAESFGAASRFLFASGLVPETLLALLTKRRLQQPIASSRSSQKHAAAAARSDPRVEAIAAEAADPVPGAKATPLEHRVLMYVRWMVVHHAGFVPAFMSCVRHAPLTQEHDKWAQLGKRDPGTTAILFAENDEIIDEENYRRDGLALVGGSERVAWRVLPGGHDFVMTHADQIMEELDNIFDASSSESKTE